MCSRAVACRYKCSLYLLDSHSIHSSHNLVSENQFIAHLDDKKWQVDLAAKCKFQTEERNRRH